MNIEDIRSICHALPSVTEDIKWGHDLVFSIGNKMFLVIGLDQIPVSASFKVPDEEFESIVTRPGFQPAPYLARHKWVMTDDITRMNRQEWIASAQQSYMLILRKLPAKLRKELGF